MVIFIDFLVMYHAMIKGVSYVWAKRSRFSERTVCHILLANRLT